ncbi:MAG: transcriptional regulator, partial [Agromyces sp.]|nr:transcriptional regulator [Agromyces sp.]
GVLQEAILRQFTPANVLTKFQEVASAGADTVKTDIPQSMLGYFVNLSMKTKELPVTSVELVPDNGVDPTDPDWEYIRSLIGEAIAPPTEEPSDG